MKVKKGELSEIQNTIDDWRIRNQSEICIICHEVAGVLKWELIWKSVPPISPGKALKFSVDIAKAANVAQMLDRLAMSLQGDEDISPKRREAITRAVTKMIQKESPLYLERALNVPEGRFLHFHI